MWNATIHKMTTVMTRLGTRPGGTSIRSEAGRISVTTDGTSAVIDTRGHDNDAQPTDVNEEEQDQSDQDH